MLAVRFPARYLQLLVDFPHDAAETCKADADNWRTSEANPLLISLAKSSLKSVESESINFLKKSSCA